MKHLTQAEYDALVDARDELQRLKSELQDYSQDAIERRAFDIAWLAEAHGFVVSIHQVPLTPLAMGNFVHKFSVRPARVRAEPIVRQE